MSNIVSHNTERMKEWSTNVRDKVSTYHDDIINLYQGVESFIGTGFKGGLADEFLETFEGKKQFFLDNEEVLNECADFLSKRADNIESEEQELMHQIKNDDYFG